MPLPPVVDRPQHPHALDSLQIGAIVPLVQPGESVQVERDGALGEIRSQHPPLRGVHAPPAVVLQRFHAPGDLHALLDARGDALLRSLGLRVHHPSGLRRGIHVDDVHPPKRRRDNLRRRLQARELRLERHGALALERVADSASVHAGEEVRELAHRLPGLVQPLVPPAREDRAEVVEEALDVPVVDRPQAVNLGPVARVVDDPLDVPQ